jgi:hypothetical protein
MKSESAAVWMLVGIPIAIIIIIILAQSAAAAKAKEERRKRINEKYGITPLAQKLIDGTIWTGETAEQLIDSLGRPLDIDQKVLKTKKKEIWKYNRTGENRYALKITLDNDVVVGWDQK